MEQLKGYLVDKTLDQVDAKLLSAIVEGRRDGVASRGLRTVNQAFDLTGPCLIGVGDRIARLAVLLGQQKSHPLRITRFRACWVIRVQREASELAVNPLAPQRTPLRQ